MKKYMAVFCLILMLTLILLPVCAFASGDVNVYTLSVSGSSRIINRDHMFLSFL